jgi:hypothetical protein
VNIDVFRFLFAVIRSVRGDANPFGRTVSSSLNFPTVLGKPNIDLVPKAGVPYFVRFVKIVYVKTANVRSNFPGAVITPIMFSISDDMAMRAWIAFVVTKLLKLSLIKIVNEIDKP